jgi:hypothetical protein
LPEVENGGTYQFGVCRSDIRRAVLHARARDTVAGAEFHKQRDCNQ